MKPTAPIGEERALTELPFELSLLSLDHLEVDRRGFLTHPGRYNWKTQYRITDFDDLVLCLVVNEVNIHDDPPPVEDAESDTEAARERSDEDAEGVLAPGPDDAAAFIHVAHMAVYTKTSTELLSEDLRSQVLTLTRMSVQPLVRAAVLTATSELGFPPLTLPLLRSGHMPDATELLEEE
ncbi:hypothetical protein [Nostocoides australiense]